MGLNAVQTGKLEHPATFSSPSSRFGNLNSSEQLQLIPSRQLKTDLLTLRAYSTGQTFNPAFIRGQG
jgi:hypothetical protein